MNKGILIGIIFTYLILVTLLATSMGISMNTQLVDTFGTGNYTPDVSVWSMLVTFFDMVTFKTTLPFIVNAFLIYPPILILVWHIIEILKDLVPFT